MKLWLDDLRPVPYGYEGAKSVNEAKKLIQEAEHNGIEIEALDLDHDLGDGGHVADVLHHGGDGDGGHDQDGGQVKLGDDKLLQAHKVGLAYLSEIHLAGDEGHNVAAHHTQQDGDDLHHALAPDVGHDDDGDGHQSQPPAGGGIGDGGAGEVQTDEDDDGAGDDGGEEAHDLLGAHQLEQQGQHQV